MLSHLTGGDVGDAECGIQTRVEAVTGPHDRSLHQLGKIGAPRFEQGTGRSTVY